MTQPTIETLTARVADIHGRNVAAGWWSDLTTGESLKGKRPALELLALIHSELSEGLEGVRKNLQDDKLPHRPMIEVELADAAIRAFDTMGGFDLQPVDDEEGFGEFLVELSKVSRVSEALGLLHILVSSAAVCFIDSSYGDRERAEMMTTFVRGLYAVAEKFGYDLDGAIEDKLSFNATRADHKPENRRAENGKKI